MLMNEQAMATVAKELGMTVRDDTNLEKSLVATVNDLLVHDFPRLISILYRLDVPEAKLRQLLKQQTNTDAAEIIAALLVERQVAKMKTREELRGKSAGDSDEEKW